MAGPIRQLDVSGDRRGDDRRRYRSRGRYARDRHRRRIVRAAWRKTPDRTQMGFIASAGGNNSSMSPYITLWNFTQQGVENVRENPGRIDRIEELFAELGGELLAYYSRRPSPVRPADNTGEARTRIRYVRHAFLGTLPLSPLATF